MNALERLTAYLCQQPGSENLDTHHAEFAKSLLDQHAEEIAARHSVIRFGRTEGLGVTQLADMLREDATALAALGEEEIAATDDPLTLLRCLHAAVGALFEIAGPALAAARLNQEATTGEGPDVAAIHDNITKGLTQAHNALRDATDCV